MGSPTAGTILRDARRARSLSLRAVAKALGVSHVFVGQVERGASRAAPLLRPDRRPVLVGLLGEEAVAAAEAALVCPTCGRGW